MTDAALVAEQVAAILTVEPVGATLVLTSQDQVATLTVEAVAEPVALAVAEQVARIRTVAEQGPAGASMIPAVVQQSYPSASWIIPHSLGRPPLVQVRDVAGEVVYPDVFVTEFVVSIVFASPTTGTVTLI